MTDIKQYVVIRAMKLMNADLLASVMLIAIAALFIYGVLSYD